MYTLLDSCLDRLDIFEFLNHLEDGLKDHYDVKVCGGHSSIVLLHYFVVLGVSEQLFEIFGTFFKLSIRKDLTADKL